MPRHPFDVSGYAVHLVDRAAVVDPQPQVDGVVAERLGRRGWLDDRALRESGKLSGQPLRRLGRVAAAVPVTGATGPVGQRQRSVDTDPGPGARRRRPRGSLPLSQPVPATVRSASIRCPGRVVTHEGPEGARLDRSTISVRGRRRGRRGLGRLGRLVRDPGIAPRAAGIDLADAVGGPADEHDRRRRRRRPGSRCGDAAGPARHGSGRRRRVGSGSACPPPG